MAAIRFGTDGWRAIIGWDFTADNVRACARGVATYLHKSGMASENKALIELWRVFPDSVDHADDALLALRLDIRLHPYFVEV